MNSPTPEPEPDRERRESVAPSFAISPFCVDLRSKKLFFAAGPPQEIDDVLDASRHCWCRKTMQALGPDGEIVDPRDCRSGRSCFESIL